MSEQTPIWLDPYSVIRMRAFDKDGNDLGTDLRKSVRIQIYDFKTKAVLQEITQ